MHLLLKQIVEVLILNPYRMKPCSVCKLYTSLMPAIRIVNISAICWCADVVSIRIFDVVFRVRKSCAYQHLVTKLINKPQNRIFR